VRLIADECDNHAIKVEEEHDKMKAELAERFLSSVNTASFWFSDFLSWKTNLLVHVQFPEYLRRIQEMLVIDDLLRVPRQERQVEQKCNPVSVD